MKFISLHFITTLKIHFHKILVKGHSKLQVTLIQNWCFQTVILEKTLESPLDLKEIKPVYAKGNQSWIFIGRTDTEGEAPILWPSDAKSWLIGKDPDAGKDLRQKEKGTKEDEIVGWHHQLNGHEFEQTPGDGEGQGSLASCSPWGRKELDTTEWLNNNNNTYRKICIRGLQTTINISGMAVWQLGLMDIFSDLLQVFLTSHLVSGLFCFVLFFSLLEYIIQQCFQIIYGW